MQPSFQVRDQTSRAGLEDTRQEFTGYNTIERLSTADGIDINSYFGNINNKDCKIKILYLIPLNCTITFKLS
jgi:hypothetical protein